MAIAQTKTGKRIVVSPAVKGAISEHLATAWLLAKGYDVFRNVSPAGRADLLAVNWTMDETIRVDVKSQGFTLETAGNNNPIAKQARRNETLNRSFYIKYLVVKDDGDCEWYSDKSTPANDNEVTTAKWWVEKTTGQRFPMPGNELASHEWSYFCYWLLKNYPDLVAPFSESFVRDMSVRGRPGYVKHTAGKEMSVLGKILAQVYAKLDEMGMVASRDGEMSI
ncbi:hypothetical protein HLI01_08900 [Rhizobium laguerreae]|uniref:hypothetical protein n=1 Tax=Rhizobium laguerreae TaxID=1076926 RepID=UPI00147954AD|nr:hypothetical protein [Rhizobium laguerreae]NNH56924.1 hypothetical protein [Rhizobium laguerreae]